MKFSKLPIIRTMLKPYFLLKSINNKLHKLDNIERLLNEDMNNKRHKLDSIEYKIDSIDRVLQNIQILTNISSRKQLDIPYTFINYRDTVKKLVSSQASFIRFGDGEMTLMLRDQVNVLQSFNPLLKDKLKKIWKNIPFFDNAKLMIGVNDGLFKLYFNQADRMNYYNNRLDYSMFLEFLHPNATYYSGSCLRVAPILYKDNYDLNTYTKYELTIDHEDREIDFYKNDLIGQDIYKQYQKDLIEPMKSIWKDRNIITIEGKSTYFGVYNDLLDNTHSITRIYGKDIDAFDDYENLLEAALKKAKEVENPIFILALGPTATVLGYELYKKGYRALDVGNFSIKYDMYSGKIKNSFNIDSQEAMNRIYN